MRATAVAVTLCLVGGVRAEGPETSARVVELRPDPSLARYLDEAGATKAEASVGRTGADVLRSLGHPKMVRKLRGGAETWTYFVPWGHVQLHIERGKVTSAHRLSGY